MDRQNATGALSEALAPSKLEFGDIEPMHRAEIDAAHAATLMPEPKIAVKALGLAGTPQSSSPRSDDRIAVAQLRKIELEIAKLQMEVDPHTWRRALTALTPFTSVLIAVSAFLFGIYQFQTQQREQQNRLLAEQRKLATATALDQRIQLQRRIRDDVTSLLQFFSDNSQTVAAATLQFEDLKMHLALAQSAAPHIGDVPLINIRTITACLVKAVEDDCHFDQNRNVAFISAIYAQWPDYAAYLKSNQADLRYITQRYILAAKQLSQSDPDTFANLEYLRDSNQLVLPKGPGKLTHIDIQHFQELFAGFQEHVKLLSAEEQRDERVIRFAQELGNQRLSTQMLEH